MVHDFSLFESYSSCNPIFWVKALSHEIPSNYFLSLVKGFTNVAKGSKLLRTFTMLI